MGMPVGKTEKPPLGPRNLLTLLPREIPSLREETPSKLKSSTITTSSERTKRNLRCTELKPSSSLISSLNKLSGAMPNKLLMMRLPPTETENLTSSDKSETTSPTEWDLLKNSLWLNFPFDRTPS